MATVHLAEDVRHHRRVAIKVLHPELSAVLGPERFLKEIELTANLQHPHILPLFDSGSADGQLYYVMPFVEGETGRDEVFVGSTEGSRAERWQVSLTGGSSPRWSQDGHEIYWIGADDNLMAAKVSTDGEFAVQARQALFSLSRFTTRGYDVLPGNSGFVMLEKRDAVTEERPRMLFVDDWKKLLKARPTRP